MTTMTEGLAFEPEDQAAEPPRCDHFWVSKHQPGHLLFWVRQCSLCHEVNWGELDREIAELLAVRDLGRLMVIVRDVDAHLDANTAEPYRRQPLAGDWARITKVCEEAGEVWKALSKATGENPRKGVCGTWDELLEELGDTASAALCAIQHVTKDEARTAAVLVAALEKAHRRVGEFAEADHG
jgi:NTP pyrophosphatase (non-canonical NTP hydrolase)